MVSDFEAVSFGDFVNTCGKFQQIKGFDPAKALEIFAEKLDMRQLGNCCRDKTVAEKFCFLR